MPIIKSAKKRVKVTKRKTAYNKAIKEKIKSALGEARKQIDKNPESKKIEELIKKTIRELDKAVSRGVIHKNTAARKKSRLMKKLHKALASPKKTEGKKTEKKTEVKKAEKGKKK